MGAPKNIPKNAQPCDSCGETWWLSEVTPGLRRLYSSMVRARARQQLIDDKALLSDEAYASEKADLEDRIDAGVYSWEVPVELGGAGAGRAIRSAFDSDDGKLQLVQLLLAEAHGEIGLKRIGEIINGNPEGISAAIRAAMGLSPLSAPPAETEPGETEKTKTSSPATTVAGAS